MCRSCRFPDMTCKLIDSGRIQLLDRVGQGGWGVVYRARDLTKTTHSLVAVKIVIKSSPGSNKAVFLSREINHHRLVSGHPNIVNIHRVFEDEKFAYIVLDYCSGGDMWHAIVENASFARNDDLVKHVFLQIIDAVQACHDKGVYHRDLKPNNILVSHDCTRVFLSDFGLSTRTKHSVTFNTGTGPYKSPECCDFRGTHAPYNLVRNDTWALGVILVNMLAGRMPWSEATTNDKHFMQYRHDPQFMRMIAPISNEANVVLQRVFCEEPSDTITLALFRQLITGVKTFWMTGEEVAGAGPYMKFIRKEYLYEDSELSDDDDIVDETSEEGTLGSLEDDSDDSDESTGVPADSRLILEGSLSDLGNSSSERLSATDCVIINVVQSMPRPSTPQTPISFEATPPDAVPQHDPSLLAPSPPKSLLILDSSGFTSPASSSLQPSDGTTGSSNTLVSQPSKSKQGVWMNETASSVKKSSMKLQNSVRRLLRI